MTVDTSLTVNFTLQDVDTPSRFLLVAATSNNPVLIPNDDRHLIIQGGNNLTGRRSLVITPAAGQTGDARIDISVSDGGTILRTHLDVTVVSEENSPPVIAPIASIVAGLYDPVDIPLEITDETPPANLSIRIRVNSSVENIIPNVTIPYDDIGGYRYLHLLPPFQPGAATITIFVTDHQGLESQAVFTITFFDIYGNSQADTLSEDAFTIQATHANNGGPMAGPAPAEVVGLYRTKEDTPLRLEAGQGLSTPLSNISGSALRTVFPVLLSSRFGGQVQITADGGLSYHPPKNFNGRDSFQCPSSLVDENYPAMSNTVEILVAAVNDAPLARNDVYGVQPEETIRIPADFGVLANDDDVEDDPLQVIAQENERIHLRTDGGFAYNAPAGFSGRDQVRYTVSDGIKQTSATITFWVGSEAVPQAQWDEYRMTGRRPLHCRASNGLLANDRDSAGSPLSIVETGIFETLFGGEVNIDSDGAFEYQPPSHFDGFDSFTYQISNGRQVAIGRVEITIAQ